MHRVESDNSVDADEPLMKHKLEGGVTILKQKDRKKQVLVLFFIFLFSFPSPFIILFSSPFFLIFGFLA
jgi:hypothetical protein